MSKIYFYLDYDVTLIANCVNTVIDPVEWLALQPLHEFIPEWIGKGRQVADDF